MAREMTRAPEVGLSDIGRVADLISQVFKSLESRREYMNGLRSEIPALESAWSSVERSLLTLGRRRRAIEAALPPLPEPRGGGATQNWVEQRRGQGSRAQGWVERLPATLALFRSFEALEAFGRRYPLPDADEESAEALRSQLREAILRQDLSSMDSLLLQIQASLISAGQRRTDLARIVDSRMAEVIPLLNLLALREATSLPELQRWQAETRAAAATMVDALSRWDVKSARGAESKLNALVDEVPEIRKRVEGELHEIASAAPVRELTHRERTSRLAELRNELDAGNLLWRAMRAAGMEIAVLAVVGAFLGLSVVFALHLTTRSYGLLALSIPVIVAAALGTGIGAIVGTRRLRGRRLAAAKEAASVDSQLANEARALAELHKRAEGIRSTLQWFRI